MSASERAVDMNGTGEVETGVAPLRAILGAAFAGAGTSRGLRVLLVPAAAFAIPDLLLKKKPAGTGKGGRIGGLRPWLLGLALGLGGVRRGRTPPRWREPTGFSASILSQ